MSPRDAGIRVQGQAAGTLPIREVSGLAIRTLKGRRELLAIGDRDFELAFGTLQDSGVPSFQVLNLRDAIARAGLSVGRDSQFEGITCDASGRLFVLEENPGHVYAFDASATRLQARIALRVRPDSADRAELADAWAANPNSRGEGIVLLDRGHLLIMKEKEPRRIIEFGPDGDTPIGLNPLRRTDAWPLGADPTFHVVPLRQWKLSDESKEDFPDLSELHADDRGRLWILSDTGRSIGRLGALDATGRITVEAVRRLHGIAGLDKPEGLVLIDPGVALVACDKPERGTPLFRIELDA